MAFGKKQNHASGAVPELGAIFMSNRATKKLCFSWKIFGLPYSKAGFVKHVKAGMFLFLFEHETRMLYGVYQACSDGAMNLSSEAFRSSGNKYPAQVKVRVLWRCKPLAEDEFRPAIKDNYFAAYKFNFGLSKNQVRELLLLFNSRKVGDELSRREILPSDPYLIQGSSWSSFTGEDEEKLAHRSKYEYEQENASAFELHKNRDSFSMPTSAVDGRLLMDTNNVTVYEEASGTTSPHFSNYMGGSSGQYGFTQVGDTFYHGSNPERDRVPKFSSGSPRAPFLTGNERIRVNAGYVHNDRLSLQNIPATGQLQSSHHVDRSSWYERAYAAADIVNTGPLINGDGIQTFAGHNGVMRDTHCVVSDSNINTVPYCPISLPEIGGEMPVDELRKPSPSSYHESMVSNSTPSCPVYRDNAVCEGPRLYDPGYGTSLRARGNYREVLNSSNSTGNLHGNIHGVRDSLSKEYPSPPGTSASILRQYVGNIHEGEYQEVLNSSNSTGNLHGNIHGVWDSLSKEYPSPPETSTFILRQSVGRPGASGIIPPISSGYSPTSQRIEYPGSENYEDAQLNSLAFSLARGKENSGPPVSVDIRGPVGVNQDSKSQLGREPASQNRRSVFSRLKPALDADDTSGVGSGGKDAQNNIDSMVTEVMEILSGHYSQLLRQFNSETKQNVDDDDDDNCASKIAKVEPPVSEETDLPVPDECVEAKFEMHNTMEMPRITFKRRSEAHKTRDAVEGGLSENSCTILSKKPSKRRKLVRPRLTDKKQSEDMVSSLPCQDASCKTYLSSSQKEWNPPQAGSSGVSAASNGQTSSNKLADGRSEIGVASEPEKQEGQALLNPAANGILEKLTEPCDSASPILTATVASSTTPSQNPKTDGKAIFDDANAESGGHGADIPSGNVDDGSCVDPSTLNLDKDGRTQTRLMIAGGNQVIGGTEIGSDMNVAPIGDNKKEGAPVVKKELGESLADFTVDVGANSNRQQVLPFDLNLSISFDAEEDTKVPIVEGKYAHKQLTMNSSIQGN